MIVLLLTYRWVNRPHEHATLFALAFLFGLGLTNHQTLMFMGLAIGLGVLVRHWRLAIDFMIVAFFYVTWW